ncbi:L-aspartate oxidase [Natronosporangium hydrolyticum]|uniref:L-aspartate oxidase n=1 Tax=Natronosporangium hydrolyticum TaxID=2811111 RepID=A0A895YG26_9ACTN|nr:L-aspartate oxidase [Natronosporangium hydrolyticum]QSB15052.1 L-aspartate oxidase [Natronosporangium hydrolyticum]
MPEPPLPDPPPLPALPHRLRAPAPGWVEPTDVAVVGSGIAGLTTALYLREAGLHVTVVTKVNVADGSTRWAQGGIAAVLDPRDSPRDHATDTLTAGAGLCDPAAVEALVTEGPARLRELIRFGADFDRHPDGALMLTREGGHRADRVVHAGGDATGAEVQRALEAVVRADPWIRLIEHALVVDLLTTSAGEVCGLTLHVLGEGSEDGVGAVHARAVVLATGGVGQIFAATTNPAVSTGDGVALALRAGAAVTDLEFIQFHPTALYVPGVAPGARPLVSEALRGEGAYLLDQDGKRFLLGQHELAELAPRDVVAKASWRSMQAAGADHVFLDARHLGGEFLARRFPTIVAACAAAGIDPGRELVPVAPAAHYASGGIQTDLHGRSSVPGLYACGEVACTGVHGANRLASNSLLEGLVFARRIATDILARSPGEQPPATPPAEQAPDRPPAGPSVPDPLPAPARMAAERSRLQAAMNAGAGVLRSADSLASAAAELRALASESDLGQVRGTDGWELTNLVTVASALIAAAYTRQESRGCHWRADRPDPDPAWRGHLAGVLAPGGTISQTWEERT